MEFKQQGKNTAASHSREIKAGFSFFFSKNSEKRENAGILLADSMAARAHMREKKLRESKGMEWVENKAPGKDDKAALESKAARRYKSLEAAIRARLAKEYEKNGMHDSAVKEWENSARARMEADENPNYEYGMYFLCLAINTIKGEENPGPKLLAYTDKNDGQKEAADKGALWCLEMAESHMKTAQKKNLEDGSYSKAFDAAAMAAYIMFISGRQREAGKYCMDTAFEDSLYNFHYMMLRTLGGIYDKPAGKWTKSNWQKVEEGVPHQTALLAQDLLQLALDSRKGPHQDWQ